MELTELECSEGRFKEKEWTIYIEKAKIIFRELKEFTLLADCYYKIARIAYFVGQIELAIKISEEGFAEIKKTKNNDGIAKYMQWFCTLFLENEKLEEAEKYIIDLVDFAIINNLNNFLAKAYEDLAEIYYLKYDNVNYNKYLGLAFKCLIKEYGEIQSIHGKAEILENQGSIFRKLGKIDNAIEIYHKVKKIYESINDLPAQARVLSELADMALNKGDRSKAIEIWSNLLNIIEGENLFSLEAYCKINIALFNFKMGDYSKAVGYLKDAERLNEKHKLKYTKYINDIFLKVNERIHLTSTSKYTYEELLKYLYDGLSKDPKSFERILRFWYTNYSIDIYKHLYNSGGLKFAIFTDSHTEFEQTISVLGLFGDYFLAIAKSEFPKISYDVFINPWEYLAPGDFLVVFEKINAKKKISIEKPNYEKQIYEVLNKPNKDGELPRYMLSAGKEGRKIVFYRGGWGCGLPQISYDFFKANSLTTLIPTKKFVSNFERYNKKDKLFSDLTFCNDIGFIPFYINEILYSEYVQVLTSTLIDFPSFESFGQDEILKLKKSFLSLLNINITNVNAFVSSVKLEIESIISNKPPKNKLKINIVQFTHGLKKITHPLIILINI